jgi:hypothetical protein
MPHRLFSSCYTPPSMRTLVIVLTASLLGCAACAPKPGPEFRPTSTVKDIMDSVVDPNADALWDSVEVIATLEGTEQKTPRTDEDWKVLRRHAVSLVEASNLLLIPGRHVAKSGEKADDARVDLHPEEIEALLTKDPAAWTLRAHWLHDAAGESLRAIDARDVTALVNAGETLDTACESCHRNYWYRTPPPDAASGSTRK